MITVRTPANVLTHLQSICARRDNETRRFVCLTGIWFNLHHVGPTRAVGRDRDVGVVKGLGGGGGSESSTAKNILFICVEKKQMNSSFSLDHIRHKRATLSSNHSVRSSSNPVESLHAELLPKSETMSFVVCSSVTSHILKERKRCTCCNFEIVHWDSLHTMKMQILNLLLQ